MKKLKKGSFVLLKRNQLKTILGGNVPELTDGFASCSAKCLDSQGNEYTVECSGDSCTSSDYNGCTGNGETKSCPNI